jgi:hypothetical protein
VWTYSYLCLLVVVFLVTDFARYKIIIVVEGFAYVATWCILLWTEGVRWMQAMQGGRRKGEEQIKSTRASYHSAGFQKTYL